MFNVAQTKIRLLTLSLLLFWGPAIVFFAIADEVLERQPLPGDVAILLTIRHTFPASMADFIVFVTDLSSVIGIVVITAAITFVLFRLKKWQQIWLLLFSISGAALANLVLKLVFRRDRPELWQTIVHEESFSFPSGHAMASSALAFAVISIAWQTRYRWPVVAISLVFMLAIGFTRLYLGVHYPSDVVAGWFVSLLWVTIVSSVLSWRSHYSRHL